jgi:A/G-specific adenine glycosylase
VCLPKSPLCLLCPVRSRCGALAQGLVDLLPEPKKRLEKKALRLEVALCRKKDATLFARRHDRGLFGGLWELPSVELLPGARVGAKLATVQRALTHRALTIEVFSVSLPARFKGSKGYADWKWAAPADVDALGMSAAMQQALAAASG